MYSVHLMVKVCIFIRSPGRDSNVPMLGLTALMALGILDSLQKEGTIKSLLEMEHNSVEYLHALVESLR
jgi:hypothetical protein